MTPAPTWTVGPSRPIDKPASRPPETKTDLVQGQAQRDQPASLRVIEIVVECSHHLWNARTHGARNKPAGPPKQHDGQRRCPQKRNVFRVFARLRQRCKAMGGGFSQKSEADHDQSGQRRIGEDDAPIDPRANGRKLRTQLSPELRVCVAQRPPGSL
jgi:hypothetical protein